MTALPGLALGPLAGIALRFPVAAARVLGVGKFLKANWKPIVIGLALVGTAVGAYSYVQHVKHVAHDAGFTEAENQAKAQVAAANKRAAYDNQQLTLLQQRYAALSTQRQQQVKIVTQTKLVRIHDEVQSNPVYRSCSITDGVRTQLQDLAAAVNASIGSTEH
jgi:hypothetical protein